MCRERGMECFSLLMHHNEESWGHCRKSEASPEEQSDSLWPFFPGSGWELRCTWHCPAHHHLMWDHCRRQNHEELAAMQSMKGTTTGSDIFTEVNACVDKMDYWYFELLSLSTLSMRPHSIPGIITNELTEISPPLPPFFFSFSVKASCVCLVPYTSVHSWQLSHHQRCFAIITRLQVTVWYCKIVTTVQ